MASHTGLRQQPPLVDDILQTGKKAFDPILPEGDRQEHMAKFRAILDNTSTLSLLPVLNLLVQPGRSHEWLRAELVSALARLPLRHRGVHDTIEFVFAHHPSTASSATSSNGAAISHEALIAISKLFSSPPAQIPAVDWFHGISSQLLCLLRGDGDKDMTKVAAYVIGFGILGRREYGAVDMPGWKAFVEPLYASLDPAQCSYVASPGNHVESVRGQRILATSLDISQSLQTLSALVFSHPNPSLVKRLLRPIVLSLWSLSAWPRCNLNADEKCRQPALRLLQALLRLSSPSLEISPGSKPTTSLVKRISQNLVFKGPSAPGKVGWQYVGTESGDIQIEEISEHWNGQPNQTLDLSTLDLIVDRFIDLIKVVPDLESEASTLFLSLCTRWLSTQSPAMSMQFHLDETRNDSYVKDLLIEGKIMSRMMSDMPEKLVSNSQQVLDLVDGVLQGYMNVRWSNQPPEDGFDDVVGLALSLLHHILISPNFRDTSASTARMDSIRKALKAISSDRSHAYTDVSKTAQNLEQLLIFRSSIQDIEAKTSNPRISNDPYEEDRKTLGLAMTYLTTNDAPPPVRAQGLDLISKLIRIHSAVLDIQGLMVLFSSLLQDSEEYIYLRVIKCLNQLSQRHPKTVMKGLIDRYVDSEEECELDQRLRLGEALLQVIQENDSAFFGEVAQSVCSGLSFVAGRRGYRPKTEIQQEKAKKLKRKEIDAAEEAWDGPVPQLDEVLEMNDQEGELISQIALGWESRRGSEDVRMRTSALSILGSSIEVNLNGVGSNIISMAIDLGIHVLTLERAPEKGILRRAAILLILGFIKALNAARADGTKLKFGFAGQSLEDIQRVLQYVEDNDMDGLVRQHARDVLESLRNWQLHTILTQSATPETLGIQHLVGLSISTQAADDSFKQTKPRIEEVE